MNAKGMRQLVTRNTVRYDEFSHFHIVGFVISHQRRENIECNVLLCGIACYCLSSNAPQSMRFGESFVQ